MDKKSGKKSKLKSDERREQIIRTATKVFSRHGFRGATMRRLARAAGISEGMIYHHFPSKEALYDAILQKKMARTRDLYFPIDAAETRKDREVLETIVSNFFQEHSKDNSFIRMMLFSALEGHDLARKFVKAPLHDFFEFLGSYMETRMREGAMRAMDGRVSARLLIGMAHFLILLREIYGDAGIKDADIEELGKLTVDLFCNGIMEPAFAKEE